MTLSPAESSANHLLSLHCQPGSGCFCDLFHMVALERTRCSSSTSASRQHHPEGLFGRSRGSPCDRSSICHAAPHFCSLWRQGSLRSQSAYCMPEPFRTAPSRVCVANTFGTRQTRKSGISGPRSTAHASSHLPNVAQTDTAITNTFKHDVTSRR